VRYLLNVFGYFDPSLSSLELRRQRAFVLTAIFMALVVTVDSTQNYQAGYLLHTREEWITAPLVFGNYLLQRFKIVTLLLASRIMAYLITFQMLFSFVVPGVGEEVMLFWIATLPLILVLLIELKDATKVNVAVVTYLAFVTISSQMRLFDALFSFEVLAQVLVGYSLFTTLVYLIEKSRSEYEEKLTDQMREREVLLKEVHHRVKNNMQLIMSLLGLQAASIEDPKYAKLFLDNIDRLSAMSLVHESIYKAENFEKINMKSYLEDIAKHLQRITRHKIEYNFSNVQLDMKTAMNLGLILNEAVTNALEHAYTDGDDGRITLALYEKSKIITMKIEDYGVGLDAVDKIEGTLGITLMKDLSNSLHDGKLTMLSRDGLEIKVYCKVDSDAS